MKGRADTLLVLGGSGFLGAHLCARALRAGSAPARVTCAARRPARVAGKADPRRLELRAWDAEVGGATEALFDEVRPGRVVLAAALARVDACERDAARAELLNAELPERVARLCAERGVRLVHVSTDLVFGGRPPRGERYDEDDPPAPAHAYGRTKAEGEARCLAADPGALVVRLPLLYGDSGGRGLGASDALLAALEGGRRPTLFDDEWRTPLEVGNAARAVLELVELGVAGTLHVAGPERVSRLELGLAVLRARGLDAEEAGRRVRAVRRADLGMGDRPADVSLDARRARRVLRETPLLAPAEALASLASP